MSILLTHNTALERLRSVPPQVDKAKTVDESLPVADVSPLPYEITHLDCQALGICPSHLHHLVSKDAFRSKSEHLKTHRTSLQEIPAGLVREVVPGVYVAGPELCFIQMAGTVSPLGAVVLGHELCGSYSHFAKFASGFYERPPLTSVKKIEKVIQQLKGMRGLSHAQKALRWVRDGSASPMETVVSCMLGLPAPMGGFGLVPPTLNYEVTLDKAAQRITGTKTARIDTAYESAKCGLEYDGKEYHRDAAKDRQRREALSHEGWTIYVIDLDECLDWERLRDKVSLLDTIPRQRSAGEVDEKLSRDLLKRLLRATRFGVGMNGVLFGVPVPHGKVKVHL